MKRRSLLAAVRDRMQRQTAVRESEAAAAPVAKPKPAPRPARPEPDHELDQLTAEARYSRERFDLYRARVMSGSSVASSPARLRELERTANAAEERLASARRARR